MKVHIIQTDNRPNLYYIALTKKVNKYAADVLHYNYSFLQIPKTYTFKIHPATAKILIVNDFIHSSTDDIIVFLDTDAWINNTKYLDRLVRQLYNDKTKHGCYSRDTYVKKNTYTNSGAFILKVNDYTRQMYNTITQELSANAKHHNIWPYDQFYISDFVYKNRGDFIIYKPEVLNTPVGIVIKHNWNKNEKMYIDLHEKQNEKEYTASSNAFIDAADFPNTSDGVDYVQSFPQINMPTA